MRWQIEDDTLMAGDQSDEIAAPTDIHLGDEALRRAMELLFFAYRDFTGEADQILADFGFGRAHHRTIYFIGRNPRISVSELLEILKITKQSLARVLGQLIDEGYVEQHTDVVDRRRRLLELTVKGHHLEKRLTEKQSRRIAEAYQAAGASSVSGFCQVLLSIIDESDRHRVAVQERAGDGSTNQRRFG